MIKRILCIYFLLFALCTAAFAEDGWHMSSFMGGSMSAPNYLRFHLTEYPDETIHAVYDNKSFTDSHWWSYRIENWQGNKVKGFELVHHKIYLANTDDIIQSFSISDGYNLLYRNWGKKYGENGRNRLRFGAGIAYGHPDVVIKGRERFHTKGPTGHFLGGVTVQFNYERLLYETKYNFFTMDTKLTLSYIQVPVSVGKKETVEAPDIALHLSFGVGSKPSALKAPGMTKLLYFAPVIYPYTVGTYILGTGVVP